MAETIRKYHGEVSICNCGCYDKKKGEVDPEHGGQRSCGICFGRGFVAACTRCGGKGSITENMAGGPGTMGSTCIACGGVGRFGVNKPEDWTDEQPKEAEPEAVEA